MNLDQRRMKLASLLSQEEQQYAQEIANTFTTTEQRMQQLKDKALKLREERETKVSVIYLVYS